MTADIRHRIVALLPRLRAFAYSLTRSRDEADDLVQATCERALKSIDSWTPGTRLDSWMFRIMRNHRIDDIRRKRPDASLDDDEAGYEVAGEDGRHTTEQRLTLGSVEDAIRALPEEQRSVLVLVCVEELSYREAAEVLDIPIGTVMSRLARARRSVAVAVGHAEEGSDGGDTVTGDRS